MVGSKIIFTSLGNSHNHRGARVMMVVEKSIASTKATNVTDFLLCAQPCADPIKHNYLRIFQSSSKTTVCVYSILVTRIVCVIIA